MPCHQNFLFLLENKCDNKAHDLLPLRYVQLCSGARICYTCAHQDTRQEKLVFANCIMYLSPLSRIEIHGKKGKLLSPDNMKIVEITLMGFKEF